MIKRRDIIIPDHGVARDNSVYEFEDDNGFYCKYEDVEKLIKKLKCCGNCKYKLDWLSEIPCCNCEEHNMWELKEI